MIGLGVFYTIVSYAFVSGWGLTGSVRAVSDQLDGVFANAFYPLAGRFVGGWLVAVLELLAVTSSFACAMAFFNTASRYLFALGREGVLPRVLARTSRHRSPGVAATTVTVATLLYVGAFVLYDPSTEGALTKLGTWTPLLGVLGILAVQALVCVAIVRYFLTTARDGFGWWSTLVAPVLGGAAMVGACYLLVDNRAALAAAEGVPFITLLPYVPLVVFVLGVGAALWLRARRPEVYAGLGHFTLSDPVLDSEPTDEEEVPA